jgi:hypothetical protein
MMRILRVNDARDYGRNRRRARQTQKSSTLQRHDRPTIGDASPAAENPGRNSLT